jgi:hypothetical protein
MFGGIDLTTLGGAAANSSMQNRRDRVAHDNLNASGA